MDRKVRRKRKDSGQRSSELNKGNIMPKAKEQKTTKKDNVQDELSHAITFLLDELEDLNAQIDALNYPNWTTTYVATETTIVL